MIDLTARQIHILRALIEEFIKTAEPVGSDTLDKKFSIGVSPATIRNEMVYLTKQGYLSKGHTSAGRVPTPLAMRLYVNELMKERELSVADEVSAKERIWHSRHQPEALLREIAHVLADRSHALGLAMVSGQNIYHSGYANLLNIPEFYDINVTRQVFSMIEEQPILEEIFNLGTNENQVQVVYGPELGNPNLQPVGVMYVSTTIGGQKCQLCVIGSARFEYWTLVPMLRYLRGLVEELAA